MTPVSSRQTEALPQGDGLSHPSLDELLALRHQVPRLRSGVRARSAPSGQHLSHLHARGVDYAESRIYQPGDDIRVMDWRVTARTGKPHTKLFLEERERELILLLDLNPSMRFGTRKRFKSVQALRAAALATWLTVAAGDRIGAFVFGGRSDWMRPRGGTRGALALLGDLMRADRDDGQNEQNLSDALDNIMKRLHGGSRVLLISDGFSCDIEAKPRLMRLRGKADVAVLGIADAFEMQAPHVPSLAIESEGQRIELQLHAAASRQSFQSVMGRGRRQLGELCRQCGVRVRWLQTDDDPLSSLHQLLLGTLRRRR